MIGIEFTVQFSVVMTKPRAEQLLAHLDKGPRQEDLTFAAWRPSQGTRRYTAVLGRLILPEEDERILQGNVAFTSEYLRRALAELRAGEGLALIHSHPGRGWQGMSDDDVVAEQDRLASPAFGRTGLPIVGLTSGNDGSFSARAWVRSAPRRFERVDAATVRVVGRHLRTTFHPAIRPASRPDKTQVATVSVWGEPRQADLARCRVGIVGLGSVGSIVAESLARTGVSDFILVDHDRIEDRNLDRTAGSVAADARIRRFKVKVAARNIARCATATAPSVVTISQSLLTESGYRAALDCDVLFSCVDRPWPRHLLNAIAYSQLIPVIDGGIFALVEGEKFLHADWRVQAAGPERPCLVCVGALNPEDVMLDLAGKLDDPDYIQNLSAEQRARISRRNVHPFSMSVAAHEILQFLGVVTGLDRIGGAGPQMYHCYPGRMDVDLELECCRPDCDYDGLTASAADLLSSAGQRPG